MVLVIGIVLVLMETVLNPVGLFYWSLSIGGLLKPLNSNAICPITHYMVLMAKSGWFVMVFVVETISRPFSPDGFNSFFQQGILKLKS